MTEIEYQCPHHPDAQIEGDHGDLFCSRCGTEPVPVDISTEAQEMK